MATTFASIATGDFASAREQFLAELVPYPVAACSIVDDDIVDGCFICKGDVTDTPVEDGEERVVLLHDTHAVGEKCARHWLATSNSCPKCRTPLFEEDNNDNDGNDGDATESEEQYYEEYDEGLTAHLQWQVDTLMARDPKTQAYDDSEVLSLLCDVFQQMNAAAAADPTSEDPLLLRLFYDILEVRLQWCIHSPEQLNVQVTETFSNLFDAPGPMPAHHWHDRVLIDFDCSSRSLLRTQCFVNTTLNRLDDEEDTMATAAAHPLSILVVDSVEQALRELQGLKVTVADLRQHLRNCFQRHEKLESLNFLRPLPYGFSDFMEYAQDVTKAAARAARTEPGTTRAKADRAWGDGDKACDKEGAASARVSLHGIVAFMLSKGQTAPLEA